MDAVERLAGSACERIECRFDESFPVTPGQPPRRCTVASARAYVHTPAGRTGAYVQRGDVVDTVPAAGEPKALLARFKGKKRWTLGLLDKSDLRCKR